jgi:hypothetical protein
MSFTSAEWRTIRATLNADPTRYGLPSRIYGSAICGSFNIRKLGAVDKRDEDTWRFLTGLCRHFDLLAIQEVMTDTAGIEHIADRLGPDFGLIVSDTTGAFPNAPGLDERLAFLYNRSCVRRRGVVTDVTYDRTKVLQTLAENLGAFHSALAPVADQGPVAAGAIRALKMPTFLAFIRTPFGVEFELFGQPGSERFQFMAVNAHLNFGQFITDRRQEFEALLDWLLSTVHDSDASQSRNLLLLADLNLDFDNPTRDLPRIAARIRELNARAGDAVNVLFPLLDAHPRSTQLLAAAGEPMRTNARVSETFDQVGVFSRDVRLQSKLSVAEMGAEERGPDYGVIDFANLFAEALLGHDMHGFADTDAREAFVARFEHTVSDHLPVWFRFRLPDAPVGDVG